MFRLRNHGKILSQNFAQFYWVFWALYCHFVNFWWEFLAGNQLYELKSHRRGCCCGCPKKTIAIFSNKQWLLSLDMKTKVVQHVEREWMREWESERVWECESVKVREWLLSLDMKTKVQHVERVNESVKGVKVVKVVKLVKVVKVKECESDFCAETWKQKLFSMSR